MAEATAKKTQKRPAAKTATRSTATGASSGKKIRIQWTRSAISAPDKHKRVVKGLGFTRLNQVIEREDTPSIRGMVQAVPHLVQIIE
jgi:large subunit ribosomal protein L30